MADHEDEDLQLAIRMSMESSPKRSKPAEATSGNPEAVGDTRRLQREMMAVAAEKRMMVTRIASPPSEAVGCSSSESPGGEDTDISLVGPGMGERLTQEEAELLFSMVFGDGASKKILSQWTNQGIRFSDDPETSMGLVQHEGGPCGVLATIQAFVLKHLLFVPDELSKVALGTASKSASRSFPKDLQAVSCNISSVPDDVKLRALVKSMGEILFSCGSRQRAAIATLSVIDQDTDGPAGDEAIIKALESVSIESASDLQKILRVHTYTSEAIALQKLEEMIPVFLSRMGALLFLISALLSRGLDMVQSDRDDPSLPLVTAPFGHASQEIVNLLLCGQAVPNVFDGRMDLGGGMSLNGISTNVEVGFLTLLESLNYCKVGQNLKQPHWPIWVVGSESHYTVLFALDSSVQEENELEERESQIRRVFDSHDQSGGGGFIGVDGFRQVLRETNIRLSPEKTDSLCSSGFIVWSEFWQVILDLDKSFGGLKDSSGLMGKKVFDLYHFNGIAKSDRNGSQNNCGGETAMPRPRLTKLRVSVPPRWTPEEYMADVVVTSSSGGNESSTGKEPEVNKPEPLQYAPLVDCIRTRWPRAVCNWVGDPPSIV